jgi:hypothetical protein
MTDPKILPITGIASRTIGISGHASKALGITGNVETLNVHGYANSSRPISGTVARGLGVTGKSVIIGPSESTPSGEYVPLDGSEAMTDDLITTDVIKTRSPITITRDDNGKISVIAKSGGLTFTITRDINGRIESVNDGTRTRTFSRDSEGRVTGVVIS